MAKDIYEFIKEEEIRYGQDIEVMDNWNWCMKEHIRTSIMMKHGKFIKSTNDLATKNPNRNIIYPLLNLRYRAEDIDMKDVVLYVDDPEKYHLSFLVKKYHDDVYVRDNDLDTFFDDAKEEKIDLGGVLVRKGKNGPVMEPMDSIAFCDQTDILSGPIGFKLFYSPDELYAMEKQGGWGKAENGATTTIDTLVSLAEAAKQQDSQNARKTQTPGKYIEVYRVHGSLPKSWLSGDDTKDDTEERYFRQIHVVAFYKDKDNLDTGVTLYRKREYENPFKLHLSGRKLRNRGLAYGGVEEIFDPQIWTNYAEIRKRELLDAVSKIIRWTNDENLTNRNKINEMDNNELLVVGANSSVGVLDNGGANIPLFTEWLNEWDRLAQSTSGATDALLGKDPSAGTPFRLEALVTQQGQGLHEYRKGKFATFIAEIYKDWIIPDIAKKITGGVKFLSTLSGDEMEYVSNCLVRNMVNDAQTERVLSGQQVMDDQEKALFEEKIRQEFAQGGNKRFLEILKDEFEDVTLNVKVNVAGKQKDLMSMVDKLTNIWRDVLSNPAILQDPKAVKVFNKLIEYSGLEPIDFGYATSRPPQAQALPAPAPANQPTA